jgi:GTP cyclohydrolase II/3,4-dihydroxy 2-butanone 4-phosphate synthase/GTP cyclohydrolase II
MENKENLSIGDDLPDKQISFFSEANVPTEYGVVKVIVFKDHKAVQIKNQADEHIALVFGNVQEGEESVLVRIHSECWTGEVLHSLKCDCREQFDTAITTISKARRGVILYLRQEGRGIGLGNKIKSYALQEKGLDTFEANRALGFDDDMRDFSIAKEMLSYLGVRSVCLLTNNPLKVAELNGSEMSIVNRKPLPATHNPHNSDYIKDKNAQMGHDIRVDNKIKNNDLSQIIISSNQIDLYIDNLARKIAHDYAGQEIVMVGILPNSFMFYSDLLRRIWNVQVEFNLASTIITCDFIGLHHYAHNDEDRIIFEDIFKTTADLSISITGKRLLLVDGICNTGSTMNYIRENLLLRQPLDIKTCTLFSRLHKNSQSTAIDYVGFPLEHDNFIIGYGMGYYNKSRNVPFISSTP